MSPLKWVSLEPIWSKLRLTRVTNLTEINIGLGMMAERKWFWAFPQIEGVPPSPRGGHSATLIGASILYFGVTDTISSFLINFI